MGYFMKIGLLFVFVLSQNIPLKCEPDYTYDFVHSKFQSKTPDIVTGDFQVTRIARGIYGLTGFSNIKQDLTDRQKLSFTTYYSRMGSNFERAPYFVSQMTLSQAMNTFYREFVQDVVSDCEENIPRINLIFIPPLKKQYLYIKNCTFSNDNWPSKIRSGYYNLVVNFTNQAVGSLEIMIKVESND